MSHSRTGKGPQVKPQHEVTAERLVYVTPQRAISDVSGDKETDLFALWSIIWRGKWLVLLLIVFFSAGSVTLALSMTQWYRAEVLLAPAEPRATTSVGGQLGSLAALAGVTVGGGGSAEAIAILRSRDFARDFVERYQLLPIFFANDWDSDSGKWSKADQMRWPDSRDAIKFFHEEVLSVSEARDTGLVTLVVEWIDPSIAARWAMELTRLLNQRLRERALLEAEANVVYLQNELARTNVVTLQQTIGRLLESELQKLMLARGNEEFAFRVIDGAAVPKVPSRPRRALIVGLGTIFGLIVGIFAAFLSHAIRARKLTASSND